MLLLLLLLLLLGGATAWHGVGSRVVGWVVGVDERCQWRLPVADASGARLPACSRPRGGTAVARAPHVSPRRSHPVLQPCTAPTVPPRTAATGVCCGHSPGGALWQGHPAGPRHRRGDWRDRGAGRQRVHPAERDAGRWVGWPRVETIDGRVGGWAGQVGGCEWGGGGRLQESVSVLPWVPGPCNAGRASSTGADWLRLHRCCR